MAISKDPTYPLFPIFSFIGFLLCIIPLPWHIQARNSGTCAFMLWTASFCLVKFVGSVVWAGNVADVAPVWCDISIQVMLGATVGIPASALCISRRLYKITNIRSVSTTRSDRRRAILEDVAIAFGLPIIILVLHIVVHAHRYDIHEDIGCAPVTYNTIPAYFLFFMWPVLISLVSMIYSVLNLRTFYIRRVQFNNLIATRAAMSTSHYIRLMTLALVDILFSLPLGTYVIFISLYRLPLKPWISWADTHFDFGRVVLIPSVFWRNDATLRISIELNRWIGVFCAFAFFALFGFASEAQKNYRLAFWYVARKVGYRKPPTTAKKLSVPKYHPMSGDSLPLYKVSGGQIKKSGGVDTDLFKTTVDGTSSFGHSTVPSTPTTPPHSPPSYEWPSTPTVTSDGKHLSLISNASTDCRRSSTTTCLASPTQFTPERLEHPVLQNNEMTPGTRDVSRPDPVYIPDARMDASSVSLPLSSPPFSPVVPYHRPMSPDMYPLTKPFGGF